MKALSNFLLATGIILIVAGSIQVAARGGPTPIEILTLALTVGGLTMMAIGIHKWRNR